MMQTHDTPALLRCTEVAHGGPQDDAVELDYEGRFLRRKRLITLAGRAVLVDLPEARSLRAGDVLLAGDLRVAVLAAAEPLLEVRGDLPRMAWHIGNRHTPCEIGPDWLRLRDDHVLRTMLLQLGADIAEISAPFQPEGGAYGHGRTFGHDHGADAAAAEVPSIHKHGHERGAAHDQASPGHRHGHDR